MNSEANTGTLRPADILRHLASRTMGSEAIETSAPVEKESWRGFTFQMSSGPDHRPDEKFSVVFPFMGGL